MMLCQYLTVRLSQSLASFLVKSEFPLRGENGIDITVSALSPAAKDHVKVFSPERGGLFRSAFSFACAVVGPVLVTLTNIQFR